MVLKECSERGIPIIAYAPLHRSLLTDYVVENSSNLLSSLPENGSRKHFDRFSPENFDANVVIAKKLYDFAHKKRTSLEILALSWIVKLSGLENFRGIKKVCTIIPIPSGSTKEKVDNNFNTIDLSDKDFEDLTSICEEHTVQGYRYNKHHVALEFA